LRFVFKRLSELLTLVRARAPAFPAITGSFQNTDDFSGIARQRSTSVHLGQLVLILKRS
jgi:hypothetical protein